MNVVSHAGATVVVCAALVQVGLAQPAIRDFARDLQSPVAAVRTQAAVELGRNADPSAVPLLLPALKDARPAVRREAAKALGTINDGRAVPALIESLGDDDKNVRMYSAYALGEIKDARAAEALLQAFRDPEWCVRDQAAWALRELRDPQLAGRIAALLQGQSSDAAAVTWILRGLGDERAVQSLAALRQAPQAGTRIQAVRALGELRAAAALPPLLAALQDADAGVREQAVVALAGRTDPAMKRTLETRLTQEPEARIRGAIQQLLQAAFPAPEPAAWWSFDDRNTQTARDVTGRGSDGEIKGGTPVPGKVGAALQFGGRGLVSLGKVPKLPLANQPLTVMAWIRPETKTGVVVARGGAYCGFSLYLQDGRPKFGIHRERDGPTSIAAGRTEVARDWVHLAGVIRNESIELFVNGKREARTRTDGYIPGNCGQGMEIGGDLGNSPAEITDAFSGIIDEVKVFLAALDEEELARQCTAH